MLFICIKKDYTLKINRKRFLAVVSKGESSMGEKSFR